MSIKGKTYVRRFVAGAKLFVAALLVLPSTANARGTDRRDSDTRDRNQDIDVGTSAGTSKDATKATNGVWPAGAYGGAARLVSEHGRPLWSNARGQSDATLRQILGENERTFEPNGNLATTNPRLVLSEQEPLVVSVAKPLSAEAGEEPIEVAFQKEKYMANRRICAARASELTSGDKQDSCWDPTRPRAGSRSTITAHSTKSSSEPSGMIWVRCSIPLVTLGLRAALEVLGRVYCGQEAPTKSAPTSIVCCPDGEDVASEVRRLQLEFVNIPILVLGLDHDVRVARTALLAGADGFIHLRMPPEQIVRAISSALEGEALLPRDLLEALLAERVSRTDLVTLTSHEREFLELVVEQAAFNDEIVSTKELLRKFLLEGVSSLEDTFQMH